MIRFSCASCGKSLRAPAALAGKRGRCASCGAVNPIPAAQAAELPAVSQTTKVAAKRVEPSPFRSTADVMAQRPQLITSGALAVPAGSGGAPEPDFFDHVAGRMGLSGERAAGRAGWPAMPGPGRHEAGDLPPASGEEEDEIGRRINWALAAGIAFGFILGVIVGRVFL